MIDEMIAERIDGLIIPPINSKDIADRLKQLAMPIVTVNTDIEYVNRLCYVGGDYF